MEGKERPTAQWTPYSWKGLPIKQQPEYEDPVALKRALAKVEKLPPIVHQMEIEKLKSYLALACEGKTFLLQVHEPSPRWKGTAWLLFENTFCSSSGRRLCREV